MRQLARSLPSSRINIGYPGICAAEARMCRSILTALADLPIEQAVVGHCCIRHLRLMSRLVNAVPNSSANFWIPVSDIAISRVCPNKSARDIIQAALSAVTFWRSLSNKPIDVALVDAVGSESHCLQRVVRIVALLHRYGARSVIICDSRGTATPEHVELLMAALPCSLAEVEFHPHDDSGHALASAEAACRHGASHIGTSALGLSERHNMLDPRSLLPRLDIPFDDRSFARFERHCTVELSDVPGRRELLAPSTVVTGTQWRLAGLKSDACLRFGVTSDRLMAAELTRIPISEITRRHLRKIKDQLYARCRAVLPASELKALLIASDSRASRAVGER